MVEVNSIICWKNFFENFSNFSERVPLNVFLQCLTILTDLKCIEIINNTQPDLLTFKGNNVFPVPTNRTTFTLAIHKKIAFRLGLNARF